MGQTPKTLLHRRGTLSLYHYKPMVKEVYRVPILFVMATTNKAFIFDLTPGQSLMEFLLKRGHDVYVMDWNPPTGEERYLKLENYVLDFIPDCLKRVQQHSGVDDVTVVGYCFGGVLSTIYAALHTDGPLKNLVCFTTPIDWSKMTLFRQWMDARHFDIDRLVDTVGIIPPEMSSPPASTCCAPQAVARAKCGYGTTSGTTNMSLPFAGWSAGETKPCR